MKEKILALLIAKFAGVRKDGLAQLALSLSLQVETDEDATALIEKLDDKKVNDFIKDWRSDIDKEVSESNKKYESNLKKKFNFVEKEKQVNEPPADPPGEQAPEWAKALIEQNKAMQDRVNLIEIGKVKESRLAQIKSKLDGLPESFKTQKLKDFGRMQFENDEDYNQYLTEFDTDIKAFNQELIDKGLSGHSKPLFGKETDGVSSAVNDYLKEKKEGDSNLDGKKI